MLLQLFSRGGRCTAELQQSDGRLREQQVAGRRKRRRQGLGFAKFKNQNTVAAVHPTERLVHSVFNYVLVGRLLVKINFKEFSIAGDSFPKNNCTMKRYLSLSTWLPMQLPMRLQLRLALRLPLRLSRGRCGIAKY